MSDDIQATIGTTMALNKQIDDLVAQANAQLERTERLYRDFGISPAQVSAYLSSDKVSPEEREWIQKNTYEFHTETRQEARQTREAAMAQHSVGRAQPAPNRIRV